MTELSPPLSYDEPPELVGRNLTVAVQLLAGATAFFFLAFVFAYVYLRSVDTAALWRPKGLDAPVGNGTAVMLLVVASAVAVHLGRGRAARTATLGLGLALGLAALVVQAIGWVDAGFGPADGAYASVFAGWTGWYFAFALLALIWVEIQLATSIRNPGVEPAGLDAASFFLSFTAGIGVLTWAVLYLA